MLQAYIQDFKYFTSLKELKCQIIFELQFHKPFFIGYFCEFFCVFVFFFLPNHSIRKHSSTLNVLSTFSPWRLLVLCFWQLCLDNSPVQNLWEPYGMEVHSYQKGNVTTKILGINTVCSPASDSRSRGWVGPRQISVTLLVIQYLALEMNRQYSVS